MIYKQIHITEAISGVWFYHLSDVGTNAKSLCGARTMYTSMQLSQWGKSGHLGERYCKVCAGHAGLPLVTTSRDQVGI